jgi:CcmD family protein
MASLFAAFTVAWTILMIYVLTLAARQRRLRQSLGALQAMDTAPAPAETHAR